MTIEEFIEKCEKRPLPSNPMERIKTLARELAEGAAHKLWATKLDVNSINWREKTRPFLESRIKAFDYTSEFPLLEANQYLKFVNSLGGRYYHIEQKAFDLLDEADPATIFISYKRSESSAFALLIEQSLIQAGLSPFLDKQLQAGDDWHATLEKRIEQSDYLIIILGQETLKSDVTLREISWAIKYNTGIIPIWHNNFSFNSDDWPDLDPAISEAIGSKHAIRVLEENPLLYDTALRELLNRFGITL